MQPAATRAVRWAGALAAALLCLAPAAAQEPGTLPVVAGVLAVGPQDGVALPMSGRRLVRPVFPATVPQPPAGEDAARQILRALIAQGRAAGNAGDLYENRDRGHSRLNPAGHPGLAEVRYTPEARAAGLDYGLPGPFLFDAPLIGNSSTAVTAGVRWRSLPRLALTRPGGALALYQNYLAGQIHVFPEHRDHDAEQGDLFPANTPYYLVSQGSSRSDRPHLEALALILAALRPETKAFLREKGLLGPAVQMIWRRGLAPVPVRGVYLSGVAHPSVFRGADIDPAELVGIANALAPGEVPPLVRLEVEAEDFDQAPALADARADAGEAAPGERLFDTPAAVARVWRGVEGRRSMLVSAAATEDPNGRDLRFSWVLLRGDPARTRIEPLDAEGRRARITIDWQNPRPVPGRPDIRSARIDIGVFAHNGAQDSAPSFVSVLLPRHRMEPGAYADPALYPEAR